jgi:hypothetical protein
MLIKEKLDVGQKFGDKSVEHKLKTRLFWRFRIAKFIGTSFINRSCSKITANTLHMLENAVIIVSSFWYTMVIGFRLAITRSNLSK